MKRESQSDMETIEFDARLVDEIAAFIAIIIYIIKAVRT